MDESIIIGGVVLVEQGTVLIPIVLYANNEQMNRKYDSMLEMFLHNSGLVNSTVQ